MKLGVCPSLFAACALSLAACGGGAAPPAAPGSAAAAARPASSGSAAAAKHPLTLNLGLASKPTPPLPNSVLWLAKELGSYDREGLDVTLQFLDGTPAVIASMLSGDVDVGNVGTDQAVKLTAQKALDLRAINSSDVRQYFLIASRDTIGSPADLKGRNFGVANLGSLDDRMTRLVLAARGVKPSDITFVNIGAPDVRAQALVAGRLDATTMSVGTWATIQHQPGVKVLVNADDYYNAAPINLKINAASTKAIDAKPEALRRFTAAVLKISRTFAGSQDAWVNAMLKSRPDLKRADLEELWPQFKQAWAANGLMNLDQYQKTSDFLYQTPDFQGVPLIPVSAWTDTQFVDSVLRDMGVDPNLDPPGRAI
jgi:NitT/TauT family transport system substrate-binding protein